MIAKLVSRKGERGKKSGWEDLTVFQEYSRESVKIPFPIVFLIKSN
jgi:hypothetical protein